MKKELDIKEYKKEVIKTAIPAIIALFVFLVSAGYIVYRMISNYSYYERWKDYEDCGLG